MFIVFFLVQKSFENKVLKLSKKKTKCWNKSFKKVETVFGTNQYSDSNKDFGLQVSTAPVDSP